jgi:hypothetical protein
VTDDVIEKYIAGQHIDQDGDLKSKSASSEARLVRNSFYRPLARLQKRDNIPLCARLASASC